MKRVRVNIFWGKLRPLLGKLVSSTLDEKGMIPYISLSVLPNQALMYSIVYINGNCGDAIVFKKIGIYSDMK